MFSKFCTYIETASVLTNGKPSYTGMETKDLIFISKAYMKATEMDALKSKKDAWLFIANYLSSTIGAVDALNAQNRLIK